jgi:hypothetical protein
MGRVPALLSALPVMTWRPSADVGGLVASQRPDEARPKPYPS